MHPAFSVIAFTVLSGAGLGALALCALLDLGAVAEVLDPTQPRTLALVAAVGLVLVAAGLFSSTLHLANPRNAWRSLARVRTSWLSREAAVALLLLPVAAAYTLALWRSWNGARPLLALLVVLLAWAMLVCTAMIYASLKPIRHWHTGRVPLNYVLLGHASGALVLLALLRGDAPAARAAWIAAIALLAVAMAAKVEYWVFLRRGIGALTLERAIGVAEGVRPPGPARSVMAARLLDAGHSRGTFLTREFMTLVDPGRRAAVRALALGAGFVLPLLLLVLAPRNAAAAVLALAACLLGLLAERWLFFAEARHTVRLYHGDART